LRVATIDHDDLNTDSFDFHPQCLNVIAVIDCVKNDFERFIQQASGLQIFQEVVLA
jgi:hypothetical protein